MLACVRTAGHKYVVKVSRLSFEDAHLTGGEDRVYVMANRIGDDWSRGVVKCGASSRRPGTGDRIAHACPGKAFVIRTLHTDQRRVLRIVVGNVQRAPSEVIHGRSFPAKSMICAVQLLMSKLDEVARSPV